MSVCVMQYVSYSLHPETEESIEVPFGTTDSGQVKTNISYHEAELFLTILLLFAFIKLPA
jgi:hypothetical protein